MTAYFPTLGIVTAVYVMRPQASVAVNQRLVEGSVTDVMKMPTIRAEDVLVSVHVHVVNCSFLKGEVSWVFDLLLKLVKLDLHLATK